VNYENKTMQKNKPTWLLIAAILQYLTAALHTSGLSVEQTASNDTEAQLLKLMNEYKIELGAGFHPSMQNLFTSMSISFSLFIVFGGILDHFLWKRNPEAGLLKGIVLIQTMIFGIVFLTMACLTFLIPIICTGLIFLSLLVALVRLRSARTVLSAN